MLDLVDNYCIMKAVKENQSKGKIMSGFTIIIEHPTQGTLNMMWRQPVEAFSAMLFGFHFNQFFPSCKVVGIENCWIPTAEHVGKVS